MKRWSIPALISAIVFSAALWADDSHLEARELAREGRILPLEEILTRIERDYPGDILEVEFERKKHRLIYEIELLDTRGTVWELKVDAVNGDILKQELED